MTSIKSPLRYPGGKSRALKFLAPRVSEGFKEFREPFLGGGSMFVDMKQKHPDAKFWINDKYYHLYCFWKVLRDNPSDLQELIQASKDKYRETDDAFLAMKDKKKQKYPNRGELIKEGTVKAREVFKEAIANIGDVKTELEIAHYFYIINKCSYSGISEVGRSGNTKNTKKKLDSSFSPQASIQNFTDLSIRKLAAVSELIQGTKITNIDYSYLLKDDQSETPDKDVYVFLDPPYDILKKKKTKPNEATNALYGQDGDMHIGFDHEKLVKYLDTSKVKWNMTYNNSDVLKDRYSHYFSEVWDIRYGMSFKTNEEGQREMTMKKELLIGNYEWSTP
jgi:DNA adenine methylase